MEAMLFTRELLIALKLQLQMREYLHSIKALSLFGLDLRLWSHFKLCFMSNFGEYLDFQFYEQRRKKIIIILNAMSHVKKKKILKFNLNFN